MHVWRVGPRDLAAFAVCLLSTIWLNSKPPARAMLEAGSAEPVEAARRAGEQRRLLRRRTAGRDALEGIPEHRIAAAALVDREIALEHRALRAERGDAGLDIGAPGCG